MHKLCIATLFTVAKNWEQYENLSIEKWLDKLWYIHMKEYYLAIRKEQTIYIFNTDESLNIIMSNKSQTYYMIPFM